MICQQYRWFVLFQLTLFGLVGCDTAPSKMGYSKIASVALGIDVHKLELIEVDNQYGSLSSLPIPGGLSDGSLALVFKANEQQKNRLIQDFMASSHWKPLPIDSELTRRLVYFRDWWPKKYPVSMFQNGYVFILDRQTGSHETRIHDRSSFNLSIAVFDTDRDLLIFFMVDT